MLFSMNTFSLFKRPRSLQCLTSLSCINTESANKKRKHPPKCAEPSRTKQSNVEVIKTPPPATGPTGVPIAAKPSITVESDTQPRPSAGSNLPSPSRTSPTSGGNPHVRCRFYSLTTCIVLILEFNIRAIILFCLLCIFCILFSF